MEVIDIPYKNFLDAIKANLGTLHRNLTLTQNPQLNQTSKQKFDFIFSSLEANEKLCENKFKEFKTLAENNSIHREFVLNIYNNYEEEIALLRDHLVSLKENYDNKILINSINKFASILNEINDYVKNNFYGNIGNISSN